MEAAQRAEGSHQAGSSSSMTRPARSSTPAPSSPSPLLTDTTPTPIRGDFISLSSPARNRSVSPRRAGSPTKDVVLHLSLTDSQMDRLTDVISRPESPEKGNRRGRTAGIDRLVADSSSDAAESHDLFTRHGYSGSQDRGLRRGDGWKHQRAGEVGQTHVPSSTRSRSATKRSRSPVKSRAEGGKGGIGDAGLPYGLHPSTRTTTMATLAQRRGGPRPSVDTKIAQRQGSPSRQVPVIVERRVEIEARGKLNLVAAQTGASLEVSPSVYSTDERGSAEASAILEGSSFGRKHHGDVGAKRDSREGAMPVSPRRIHMVAAGTAGVEQTEEVLQSLAEADNLAYLFRHPIPPAQSSIQDGGVLTHLVPTPADSARAAHWQAHSPLTPYIESMDDKEPRRKRMFGEHGWLDRTSEEVPASGEQQQQQQKHQHQHQHQRDHLRPQQHQQPKKGIFESLKKLGRDFADVVGLADTGRNGPPATGKRAPTPLTISLEPRAQCLLYCELEFLLTEALVEYLTDQFNAGLLREDKMLKVADSWAQKGRPKVLGFRYDVETQLSIVMLHVQHFKFYGSLCGSNPTAAGASPETQVPTVAGLLDMMRANARAIRVRTFCQPDTVIAKQLLDSQKLFNVLGCSVDRHLQLHYIMHFFKNILEREHRFQGGHRPAQSSCDTTDRGAANASRPTETKSATAEQQQVSEEGAHAGGRSITYRRR